MDCRSAIFGLGAVMLFLMIYQVEGRNKKVVIHVPYKVKKIKHIHTIYKTIHHHHTHLEHEPIHLPASSEEHDHFHHMHLHEEGVPGQHSQPIPGISIPEFLPDVPMELPLKIPDVPHLQQLPHLPPKSARHLIPLFRRI